MSFKQNSIFFCAMCIFSIFTDAIPLIDDFKKAPITDAADLFSAGQISEMCEKSTPIDFKNETKNTEAQFYESLLATLASPEVDETIRLSMARISNQNRDTRQTNIGNIFNALDSCMKQNVDNNSQPFLKELRKFAASWINLNDDFSVDAQQESIPDEPSSISDREYSSRDLDEEDFTEVPALGLSWGQTTETKNRKLRIANNPLEFHGHVDEISESKSRQKSRRGRTLRSLYSEASLTPNYADDNIFGNKIFLFNKDHDKQSPTLFNKKENKGNKSHFLFDTGLPNNLSEKLKSKT